MNAGQSVGFPGDRSLRSILVCEDFPGECCPNCHKKEYIIVVYPWSVYSDDVHRMPDMSIGIHAEVCCNKFDVVRDLPRSWWLTKYAEKEGWDEADQKRFIEASVKDYYKVWGEIRDKYFLRRNPRTVSHAQPRAASQPRKVKATGCPGCGSKWDEILCDSCGYSS